jgi:hypothetical protein
MLLHVRVGTTERPGVGIWLPLFLVWLILLPIVVLVSVVSVVVDAALLVAGQEYHHYTLLLLRCFGVLGATRGMVVHIDAKANVVDIGIV